MVCQAFLGYLISKGETFGSKQGENEYLPKGGHFDSKGREKEEEVAKIGGNKGDDGFRGKPSHHGMMVSIQASVSGSIFYFL